MTLFHIPGGTTYLQGKIYPIRIGVHCFRRSEPRCWGGESFDRRQRLAQTRLFCDEDFFITGNSQNSDAILCRLLIQLGNGKIVNNARDAEYVIITDKLSEEAQELNR